MGRILVLILLFFIIRGIIRLFTRKKCPSCAMRIPKKAAVCHYCNTKQQSHKEVQNNVGGSDYVRKSGRIKSFIFRKRGKADTAILAVIGVVALIMSVYSYFWYIDSLSKYYVNKNKLILFAEQGSARKNVLTSIIEARHKQIDSFFDKLEKSGYISRTMQDIDAQVMSSYDSRWALTRILPWIPEPIEWRAKYNEYVPLLSNTEVNNMIRKDSHLAKLPDDHVFIQMLRDTYDHYALQDKKVPQRFYQEFPTVSYDKRYERVSNGKPIKLDMWVGGQSKWNPYAKDEFMSMIGKDEAIAYAILRYKYGKQAAQRYMIIQRHIMYNQKPTIQRRLIINHGSYHYEDVKEYKDPLFATEYRMRVKHFGLLDDLEHQYNQGDIRHPFKSGDFIPATVDILAKDGMPEKLWGKNAIRFASWYVFPSVFFGMLLLTALFRYIIFIFTEKRRLASQAASRQAT